MNPRNRTHPITPRFLHFLLLSAVATALASTMHAQTASSVQSMAATASTKPPATRKSHEPTEGERVFAANCSRCHTAPDGFSQHISGTVVRHMRVRASLSEQDEKALLRFFNPQ